MNAAILVSLMIFSTPSPAALEYTDMASCRGRSTAQYQALELRDKPVRPMDDQPTFPDGAKYGLVQLGPTPKPGLGLLLVWIPDAKGGPLLWLDADADGKLTEAERHVMSDKKLELSATMVVGGEPTPLEVQRKLCFRRASNGGLRYAVFGRAEGKLKLGENQYDVILFDGDGNGCLDTVGHDRLWIDLNGDGRFSLLTEQFPLGKPIYRGGEIYVVRSDPLGKAVTANLRSVGDAKLKIVLAATPEAKLTGEVEVASDIGEFAAIEKFGEFTTVPYGEYRICRVNLKALDADGKYWSYYFYPEKQRYYPAPRDKETVIPLLADLEVNVRTDVKGDTVKPGQTIMVYPEIIADESMSLSYCSKSSSENARGSGVKAEVLFIGPDGKTIQRTVDGFG